MRALLLLLLIGTAHARMLHGGATAGGSGPVPNSVAAAISTAGNGATHGNALCQAIEPYYWEIGNGTSVLVSGTVGTGAPSRNQNVTIASASKMLFATYVANLKSGTLTSTDILALSQFDGQDNGQDSCPVSNVDLCLNLTNTAAGPGHNQPYSWLNTADVGLFHYNGGHFLNLGGSLLGNPDGIFIGTLTIGQLKTTIGAKLGINIIWSSPLLSGGAFTSAASYATVLQNIINGTPNSGMLSVLGTNPVCTNPGSTYGGTIPGGCTANFSPLPANDGNGHSEDLHYAMGTWVEDGAATNGDGAYSSAGAFGFLPVISHSKSYYEIIARSGGGGQGYASISCGRLIRAAYCTGLPQNGVIPSACVL